MIIETVRFTRVEGAYWESVPVTPNEIKLMMDYLTEIIPPVSGGTIKFPPEFKDFFPDIYFYAIQFPTKTWDAKIGWRD